MFEEPAVILSDVHLDRREDWRRQLQRLRALWQGARTVVFNGDTINSNLSGRRRRCREVLDEIRCVVAADGAQPVIIGGNSDFEVPGPRYVFLAGGRVLVFHGEVLLESISPWRRGRQLAAARTEALAAMTREQRQTLDGQMAAVVGALQRVWQGQQRSIVVPPRREWMLPAWPWLAALRRFRSVLRAWRDVPALAAEFLERFAPEARVAVIGHLHRGGIWRVRERAIVNTGSIRGPGRGFVARLHNGRITLRTIRPTPTACLAGRTVGHVDVLP
jgi:predicted phosphodiesterase